MVAVNRDEEAEDGCVVADRRLVVFNIGSSFTAPAFPNVGTVNLPKQSDGENTRRRRIAAGVHQASSIKKKL